MNRRLFWSVSAVVALLGVVYFGLGGVVARSLLIPKRIPLSGTPADVGLSYEDVTVTSGDGTRIAAWMIAQPTQGAAILLVHGVNSNRTAEFQGHFMDFARDLYAAGYSVMMMDQRGHGESEGEFFSLGDKEKYDVSAVVDWLDAQGYDQIGVVGVSMGGGAASEASVINDKVDALVLDSVYPDLQALLGRELPRRSPLPGWFLPGAMLTGRVLTGANIATVAPAAHTGADDTPLYIIYGTADDLILPEEFMKFQEANPDAQTWIYEGGTHSGIYRAAREAYLERVLGFFDEYLK